MKNNIQFNIEMIIDEYSDYVFKIVDNIIGTSLSYQDKEEVVSDTFYLLWKNQNNKIENLKSYLATISRNCAYDKLRKNKINYEFNENFDSIDNFSIMNYDLFIAKEKVARLNEEDKKIFNLYYINGYKVKEIAKLINLSVSNIKIRLYRIRKN